MNKYDTKVTRRVIEFNKALMGLPGGNKISLSDALIEFARLSVRWEAEAAKDFHYAGWTNRAAYDHPADAARQRQLEYMLEQNGLIPPQTETI